MEGIIGDRHTKQIDQNSRLFFLFLAPTIYHSPNPHRVGFTVHLSLRRLKPRFRSPLPRSHSVSPPSPSIPLSLLVLRDSSACGTGIQVLALVSSDLRVRDWPLGTSQL